MIEVKEESHDLILSDDDENWTLQMEDDEEGEEEVIEVKKITDFVRESFKKEGKFLTFTDFTEDLKNLKYFQKNLKYFLTA